MKTDKVFYGFLVLKFSRLQHMIMLKIRNQVKHAFEVTIPIFDKVIIVDDRGIMVTSKTRTCQVAFSP